MHKFRNVLYAIKWFLQSGNENSCCKVGPRAYEIRERVNCTNTNKLDEMIMEPVLLYLKIEQILNNAITERQKEILLSNNHKDLGLKNRRLMQNKQHDIRVKLEPWFIKDGIIID